MTKDQMDLAQRAVRFVEREFCVTAAMLESHCREWAVVWPRWIAIYLMRTEGGMTRREIAHLVNREYSTVAKALDGVENEAQTNCARGRELARVVEEFRAESGKEEVTAETRRTQRKTEPRILTTDFTDGNGWEKRIAQRRD